MKQPILTLKTTVGFEGYFEVIKRKLLPDGSVSGPIRIWSFKNLITDYGLNRLGSTGGPAAFFRLGSGSSTPLVTQTALDAQLGSQSTTTGAIGAAAAAPYYGWARCSARFQAGNATGNISEIGLGATAAGADLWCRALILDTGGNPTTITKLADEIIDVNYEIRVYAPTGDVAGSILLGGVTYNTVSRASEVTTAGRIVSANFFTAGMNYGSQQPPMWYPGDIGNVTQQPSGAGMSAGSIAMDAYSNNSMERSYQVSLLVTDGNVAGGIKSVRFWLGSIFGTMQTSFTPAIPKDNTKTMSMRFKIGWARRV